MPDREPSSRQGQRPYAARSFGLGARFGVVVELGAAAAGFGVYLAVLGGLRQWVKLEAAGLPADSVLSGYETPALLASGAQTLVVLPVAFFAVLVAVQFSQRERRTPAGGGLARLLDLAGTFGLRALVGSTGVLVGLTVVAVLAGLPTIRGVPSTLELSLVHGACVATLALLPSLIAVAGPRWRRQRAGDAPEVDGISRSIDLRPKMLLAWGIVIVAGSGALAYTLSREVDAGVVVAGVAAVVLICGPYVVLMLQIAAAIERTVKELTRAAPVDESAQLLVFAVLASYLLPTWVGLFLAGIFLMVVLDDQAPLDPAIDRKPSRLPSGLAARAFVVSILIAACALLFQAHQPQRFALASFPVGPGLTADAALLGRADGQLLLGVCQRRRDGTSSAVRLLRVPEDRVPAYEVVDGGYVFFREHEGTILSGLLDDLGVAFRPPALRPPWLAPPSGVCGRQPRTPSWVFERLRSFEPPPGVR